VTSLLSQIQAQTVHKLSNFILGTDLAGFKASSMLLNHPTDGFQVRSILVARLTTQIVDLFIKGGRCKLDFFFHGNISLNFPISVQHQFEGKYKAFTPVSGAQDS
jgi:hypothetical protein